MEFPNSVVLVGESAFEGNKITSLKLSDSLKAIPIKTFYECTNLTGTLVIPTSVEAIGEEAFSHTGIQTLEFKSSPELYRKAFGYCTNLKEVKCYATKPPHPGENLVMYQVFEGSSNFALAVPKGCLSNYTKVWGGIYGITNNIFDELPAVQTNNNSPKSAIPEKVITNK